MSLGLYFSSWWLAVYGSRAIVPPVLFVRLALSTVVTGCTVDDVHVGQPGTEEWPRSNSQTQDTSESLQLVTREEMFLPVARPSITHRTS